MNSLIPLKSLQVPEDILFLMARNPPCADSQACSDHPPNPHPSGICDKAVTTWQAMICALRGCDRPQLWRIFDLSPMQSCWFVHIRFAAAILDFQLWSTRHNENKLEHLGIILNRNSWLYSHSFILYLHFYPKKVYFSWKIGFLGYPSTILGHFYFDEFLKK